MKKFLFILGLLVVTFSVGIAQNPTIKTAPTNTTQYGVWEGGKWKIITGSQLDSFIQVSSTKKYMKYATVTSALPSTGNLRYAKSLVRNTTTGVFTVVDSLGNAYAITANGSDINLSNYATIGYVDTSLLNFVIPNGSVSTGKLQSQAVTGNKIAINTIGTGNMLDLSITRAKIADNAVDGDKIANGSIDNLKLTNMGAVNGQVLQYNSSYNRWLPTTIANGSTPDGSETVITAGTNISVTGNGTTASPYIVNSTSNVGSTETLPAYKNHRDAGLNGVNIGSKFETSSDNTMGLPIGTIIVRRY